MQRRAFFGVLGGAAMVWLGLARAQTLAGVGKRPIIGIPAIPVPVPYDGTVSTPKIAFYERDQQTGIAKMAITSYGSDGALVSSTGPT